MKKSTLHLSTWTRCLPPRLREELAAGREKGMGTVEVVVLTLGLFALATLAIGLLTAWANGKLAGLT